MLQFFDWPGIVVHSPAGLMHSTYGLVILVHKNIQVTKFSYIKALSISMWKKSWLRATNSSNSFAKILLVLLNNLKNACINSTLSKREDFLHVCVKFMQLKFVWILRKFYHFFLWFLVWHKFYKFLLFHAKLSLEKVKIAKGKNIEWTRMCFLLASKLIHLISLLKRSFMPI